MYSIFEPRTKFLRIFKLCRNFNKSWPKSKYECYEYYVQISFCSNVPRKTATERGKNIKKIQELIETLMEKMNVQKSYFADLSPREHLMELVPKSQEELEARSMRDSLSTALIPLSSDIALQDRYVGWKGKTRIGRILEDFDMFACYILLKHCKLPKVGPKDTFPYYIVTASVDTIDFVGVRPLPRKDVLLTGHITYVGKTSAEIIIWAEQQRESEWKIITKAIFVMAARNPLNTGGGIINPLKPKNKTELEIWEKAEKRKKIRDANRFKSLYKKMPTVEEQEILHTLFLKTIGPGQLSPTKSVLPKNAIWSRDTMLTTILQGHPENRNINNTVFGGFIMRQAHELSWNLAILFADCNPVTKSPRLKRISDIKFIKPVQLNSFVTMTASVMYTHKNFFVIRVIAEVIDSFKSRFISNEVYFTYSVNKPLPEIIPKSYKHAIIYLQAKRHFDEYIEDYQNAIYERMLPEEEA